MVLPTRFFQSFVHASLLQTRERDRERVRVYLLSKLASIQIAVFPSQYVTNNKDTPNSIQYLFDKPSIFAGIHG
jgi:hypothetical protein